MAADWRTWLQWSTSRSNRDSSLRYSLEIHLNDENRPSGLFDERNYASAGLSYGKFDKKESSRSDFNEDIVFFGIESNGECKIIMRVVIYFYDYDSLKK